MSHLHIHFYYGTSGELRYLPIPVHAEVIPDVNVSPSEFTFPFGKVQVASIKLKAKGVDHFQIRSVRSPHRGIKVKPDIEHLLGSSRVEVGLEFSVDPKEWLDPYQTGILEIEVDTGRESPNIVRIPIHMSL